MRDLSYLIDAQKCIMVRNEVQDELYSWGHMLYETDVDDYYKIIDRLTQIIEIIQKESK